MTQKRYDAIKRRLMKVADKIVNDWPIDLKAMFYGPEVRDKRGNGRAGARAINVFLKNLKLRVAK